MEGDPAPDPAVGLCSACRFAAVQRNARGNAFWRCGRSDTDPGYLRYPPLPVSSCPGYEEGTPQVKGAVR